MTTHKGLPVSGYREQTGTHVALVNRNKEIEERVLRMLDDLEAKLDEFQIDPRWLAIGRVRIEEGFMMVNRSIFRPARVSFPEDILREDHARPDSDL